MPSGPNLKFFLSVAGLVGALALGGQSPALAQYQKLDPAPARAGQKADDERGSPAPYGLVFTRAGSGLVMSGIVPSSAFTRYVSVRAGEGLVDRTRIRGGAPDGFVIDALAALAAVELLADGRAGRDPDGWFVEGSPVPGTSVSDIAAMLSSAATPPDQWRLAIAEPPVSSGGPAPGGQAPATLAAGEEGGPQEADAQEAGAPAPRGEEAAAARLDACREEVADYMADKAILFPSASAIPDPASLELLAGLAERLAACPDAPVYVEGHTDADGSAAANLSLSIRRAESVVDALVRLGVDPARLYAVGYGASLPIAPNDTPEGKRQNRRIVFSFEDIARPLP